MKPQVLTALKKMEAQGFQTHVFANGIEMRDFVLSSITLGQSIGFGGSMTVCRDLNLYELFKARGNTVYNHAEAPTFEELKRICAQEYTADVYLVSSNAITYDGRIYNVDGHSNRVAALANGPDIVYILVGTNKFVEDDAAAVERVQTIAAPMNAKRLGRKTPCAATGVCSHCLSPDRICRTELWMEKVPDGREIHICVADEALGF